MQKIKYDDYKKMNFEEKFSIDSLLSSDIEESEEEMFLNENFQYLRGLNHVKYFSLNWKNISYLNELKSTEAKLLLLSKIKCNDKKILKKILKENSKEMDYLIYNTHIRDFLIENKAIVPNDKEELQKIVFNLNNSFKTKNNIEIYNNIFKLTMNDFINFKEELKKTILNILDLNSEKILYITGFLFEEDKINYGSWKDFWYSISNYDFTYEDEDNTMLYSKYMCITTDFNDERINMKLFPNLPTIYDDEDFADLNAFFKNIDWTKNFNQYELDFILAANIDNKNSFRTILYNETFEKIKNLRN